MYDYRIDKLLSAWIFVYSIFYIFGIVRYNPIILLYIAYAFAFVSSIYIYVNTENITKFYLYVAINFLVKQVPILIIQNDQLGKEDIIFTLLFILMYLLYMTFIQENVVKTYQNLILFVMDKNEKMI